MKQQTKMIPSPRQPRILTGEEERRLLEACSDGQRAQLRPIIIAAIDTGMRRREILPSDRAWARVKGGQPCQQ